MFLEEGVCYDQCILLALLSHKKEGNNAICNNMDGHRDIILSEVNQTKTNVIWYHLYVDVKIIQMNLFTKQK